MLACVMLEEATVQSLRRFGTGLILLGCLLSAAHAEAVPMQNDPKGYHDLAWGISLTAKSELELTREGPHVREYQFKNTAHTFAGIPVESVRLSTVDEQFARVTVRYQGEATHKRIMVYLEKEFGPIERIPGQMMRGLNQQYNWRGVETEVNVTYQGASERGYIFLDSRTLAPRFNDHITDSSE